MAFLKKVDDNWGPTEFPNIKVGDIVDFPGPYEALVRKGSALLVDEDGNELELPGQTFECPVCFKKFEGLKDFVEHVSTHMPKPKEVKPAKEPEKVVSAPEVKAKDDDIRAKRLAALEKARAAKKAKK